MADRSPRLRVAIVGADGGVTVEPGGEVDLACIWELRERLDTATDTSLGDLTIDVSEVSFLDSTGLSVLGAAHHRLGSQ